MSFEWLKKKWKSLVLATTLAASIFATSSAIKSMVATKSKLPDQTRVLINRYDVTFIRQVTLSFRISNIMGEAKVAILNIERMRGMRAVGVTESDEKVRNAKKEAIKKLNEALSKLKELDIENSLREWLDIERMIQQDPNLDITFKGKSKNIESSIQDLINKKRVCIAELDGDIKRLTIELSD